MGSLSEDLASADTEEDGRVECFRVKYLGCASFTLRKKRLPKGIASMQRPLLDVYASARKKGETHMGSPLFPIDQRLDVLEYGLVVAEAGSRAKQNGNDHLVLVKVLTPLSNAVLWAAVRFQARALRKRVLGAAFVPLACCDSVIDNKGFLRLDAKHRFLVSLSHPSVFSVVFRRVTDPRRFECHAFACASAREALALGSALSLVRERSEMPPPARRLPAIWPMPPQNIPETNVDNVEVTRRKPSSRRRRPPPTRRQVPDSDETNSYASIHKPMMRTQKTVLMRRRRGGGGGGTGASSESSSCPKVKPIVRMEHRVAPIGGSDEPSPQQQNALNGWTPISAPSSSASFLSPSDESCSLDFRHQNTDRSMRRDVWTMTEDRIAEQEKTIDLSSESGSSSGSSYCGGVQRSSLEDQSTNGTGSSAPVKYTYFGYETFRSPTWTHKRFSDDEGTNMGTSTKPVPKIKSSAQQQRSSSKGEGINIVGNGTGRVTINVPFSKKSSQQHRRSAGGRNSVASTQTDASSTCSAAVLLPMRGVRSFRSDRQVGDWSTLSQSTSDEASVLQPFSRKQCPCSSSYSSSSMSNRQSTRTGKQQRPHKILRWSSENRLPSKSGYAFFWSLKKLSLQSFTKAKYKTGKLISSMRTKLMGSRKCPEGSEDSAYDTSEVCLSPSGRATCTRSCCTEARGSGMKARRQQSWSFHDLRAVEDRSPDRTATSEIHRPVIVVRKLPDKHSPTKRRVHRRKNRRRFSSASDSGVEEYPSDGSAMPRSGSDRTDNKQRVTRVQIHHGMSEESFQRWSHTNIQDELGYIP